jgi:hypothetical protein
MNVGRLYFWRLLGVGFAVLGLGVATGIGFYGYSFVKTNTDNISILSATFSKALAEVQLRASAEGTVQIEPREISLAKGQTVSLERNATVRLDPAAKVLVDGDINVQIPPTISTPRTVAQPSTAVPNITNFTVFKSVRFDKGAVMTGWNFLTSTQKAPTGQYCYYTVNAETPNVGFSIDLGKNEKQEIPETVPENIDFAAAFDKCVWFRSDYQ